MQTTCFKIFLTGCLITLAGWVGAAVTEVDVRQGATLQSQGALLIDVREPDEYAQGHAPGARLIPLGQLQQRLGEIAAHKNKPVALICRTGRRSAMAADILNKAGFTQAVNVGGGMMVWQQSGLPVVSGAANKTTTAAQ